MSKNRAASIRARLKNRSDAAKQDFNLTLTHYGLERLLYRLSVSSHAPNFLLKGALLFKLWYDVPQWPTRDADLLGFGPDDINAVAAVFRDICVIEVDDGIAFEARSVQTAETSTHSHASRAPRCPQASAGWRRGHCAQAPA